MEHYQSLNGSIPFISIVFNDKPFFLSFNSKHLKTLHLSWQVAALGCRGTNALRKSSPWLRITIKDLTFKHSLSDFEGSNITHYYINIIHNVVI